MKSSQVSGRASPPSLEARDVRGRGKKENVEEVADDESVVGPAAEKAEVYEEDDNDDDEGAVESVEEAIVAISEGVQLIEETPDATGWERFDAAER